MEPGGQFPSTDRDQALERLRHEVESLRQNTAAQAVLLLNSSGQILVELGEARGVDASILGMLVAGGMATTMEMAEVLQEPQVSSLHFYRGKRHEIYASAVDQGHLVCLILEKYTQQTQIGMVWLYIKRSLIRVRRLLQVIETYRSEEPVVTSEDLDQAISQIWETDESAGASETDGGDKAAQRERKVSSRPLYTFEEASKMGILRRSGGSLEE